MGFATVDDRLFGHPKAMAAGLEAMGLWVLANSWSCAFDKQGFIPSQLPETLKAKPALADRLVEVGLWDVVDGGWMMHDWQDWNLTAAERLRKRRLAAKRVARHRDKEKAEKEAGNAS